MQLGDQWPRAQHFAHGHGMHPDRLVTIQIERQREIPEPLPDAADILVVAQRLVEKVRRRRHEHDERDDAVEEIHGNLRETQPLRCLKYSAPIDRVQRADRGPRRRRARRHSQVSDIAADSATHTLS